MTAVEAGDGEAQSIIDGIKLNKDITGRNEEIIAAANSDDLPKTKDLEGNDGAKGTNDV